VPRSFLGAALFVVLLIGWELAGAAWPKPALPRPSGVGVALLRLIQSGALIGDLGASLSRVGAGFALAAALGLPLGALAGLGGRAAAPLRLAADLLRPVPPIAWVPLALVWFGLGDPPARFIVFVGAVSPIFAHTRWALHPGPAPLLELARSLGASPWRTLVEVRLPAAAPGVAAGLRTGLSLAWVSVIAAELVGAQDGLGYRIQALRLGLDVDGVVAVMGIIGGAGYLMDRAARAALPAPRGPR